MISSDFVISWWIRSGGRVRTLATRMLGVTANDSWRITSCFVYDALFLHRFRPEWDVQQAEYDLWLEAGLPSFLILNLYPLYPVLGRQIKCFHCRSNRHVLRIKFGQIKFTTLEKPGVATMFPGALNPAFCQNYHTLEPQKEGAPKFSAMNIRFGHPWLKGKIYRSYSGKTWSVKRPPVRWHALLLLNMPPHLYL